MIFRWRIEAEADNKDDAQKDIEEGTNAFRHTLKKLYPELEWECTDDPGPKAIARDGKARIYQRRVFRVKK